MTVVSLIVRVLILDDDEELCGLVSELLACEGDHVAVIAHSVDELVAREREVLGCDLAILDVNLGPNRPSGLDAHAWLKQRGFTGRVVFLTGHARQLLECTRAASGAPVLEKPISTSALVSLVASASADKVSTS